MSKQKPVELKAKILSISLPAHIIADVKEMVDAGEYKTVSQFFHRLYTDFKFQQWFNDLDKARKGADDAE